MHSDLNEHLLGGVDESSGSSGDIDFKKIFNNEYNNGTRESEKYYLNKCQSAENLARIFKADLENGLDENNTQDLEWREKMWGNNHLPPEEENSIIQHIIDCFDDPTLRVLVLASIVSLIIGIAKDGIQTGWIEGTAIFFAVFIVVSISSYMNYNKKEQFLKLSRETKLKKVVVKRNGCEKEISLEGVLVGDILKLRIGDVVNVDGVIYGDGKVDMDESPVTGESDLMRKIPSFVSENKKYYCPFIFSGSQVQDGQGNMLVCAVGPNTFEGGNKALLNVKGKKAGDEEEDEDADLTPLKKQLNELADMIGNFGYIMAILIGSLMIVKETILRVYYGLPIIDTQTIDVFVNAFIIAVTVIVVAIPEGLPMAVTISLAYSVEKMKDEHNLVKHLDSSETMGNVNNVCTDKTGTLTEGVMRLIAFFIEQNDYRIDTQDIQDKKLRDLIWNCIYKNITVVESRDEKGNTVLSGDMTEKALYKYLKENGYQTQGNRKGMYVLPFKSDYKYMMNIYKNEEDGNYILYAKGAPERVSEFITKFRCAGGKEDDFANHEEEWTKQQQVYADDSIRTLVFAYKVLTQDEIDEAKKVDPEIGLPFFQQVAKGLTFAFMIGIRDNNRKDVPDAIVACKRAGITVRMVTGDNIHTALAISRAVGIIEPDQANEARRVAELYKKKVKLGESSEANKEIGLRELVQIQNVTSLESPIALEGEVFRVACGGITRTQDPKTKEMTIVLNNVRDFTHTVKKLKVIARASPEDKFILVFGLKQLGNIVAVTGDGTNDAPALKQSHVGFAMGIRGTDIAKDAADIVLLDDSFSSIVTACKYGRNVYDCLRKFVQFQLTTNVVAVFMTFLGGIILKDSPLNAIEMLWVNLIMDSFASLALATESPHDSLLDRKPYSRDASILTPMMLLNISSQAIFQILTLTVILFYGDIIFGVPSDRELEHFMWNDVNGYHFTLFFDIFVFMQVCNSINARKLNKHEYNVFSGILGNWYYIFIQSFILFGQIVIVTFGGRAVRVQRLSLTQHLQCLAIASLSLIVGFFVKLLPIDTSEPVAYGEDQEKPVEKKKSASFGYASRGGKKLYGDVGIGNKSSKKNN